MPAFNAFFSIILSMLSTGSFFRYGRSYLRFSEAQRKHSSSTEKELLPFFALMETTGTPSLFSSSFSSRYISFAFSSSIMFTAIITFAPASINCNVRNKFRARLFASHTFTATYSFSPSMRFLDTDSSGEYTVRE